MCTCDEMCKSKWTYFTFLVILSLWVILASFLTGFAYSKVPVDEGMATAGYVFWAFAAFQGIVIGLAAAFSKCSCCE